MTFLHGAKVSTSSTQSYCGNKETDVNNIQSWLLLGLRACSGWHTNGHDHHHHAYQRKKETTLASKVTSHRRYFPAMRTPGQCIIECVKLGKKEAGFRLQCFRKIIITYQEVIMTMGTDHSAHTGHIGIRNGSLNGTWWCQTNHSLAVGSWTSNSVAGVFAN